MPCSKCPFEAPGLGCFVTGAPEKVVWVASHIHWGMGSETLMTSALASPPAVP